MRRLLHAALLAVVVTLPAQSGCALLADLFQKPTVTLENVVITGLSFEGISASFVFAVMNPNPIGASLAGIDYQITVDGHQFAAGHADQPLTIPPQARGRMTLPVGVKFVDFAQSLEALFTKQSVPYGLATTISFNSPVGPIPIPLSTEGTFPVPHLPDVSLSGATMGAVDLTGASFSVGLVVKNTNAFALPLGSLGYKVSVAGVPVVESVHPGQSLAAGATQTIPIGARIDFLKTGIAVFQAVQAGRATLAFDGALDLGVLKKPVHFEQLLGK